MHCTGPGRLARRVHAASEEWLLWSSWSHCLLGVWWWGARHCSRPNLQALQARVPRTVGNRTGSTGNRPNRSGPVHKSVLFPVPNRAYIIFYPHRTSRFHRFTGRFFFIRGNRYGGGLGNPAPSWLLCSYRAPLPFGPQWFLRLYVAGTAGFGIFSLCLCTNNVARTQTLSRGPYTTANYSILASVLIS
jgi:hypothetical protein